MFISYTLELILYYEGLYLELLENVIIMWRGEDESSRSKKLVLN
jgi:hypothetical protein